MEYRIIELEDMSSAAKRISAKVTVNLTRGNQNEIKELVIGLVSKLRKEKIEKPKTLVRHGNKPFEVVYLYLYNNLDQKNHGLPLARASFIDSNCEVKPYHFSDDFIDANTTIKFDGMFEALNDSIEENMVSNEIFINRLKSQLQVLTNIYDEISNVSDNLDRLKQKAKEFESDLISIRDEFIGYPNDEYANLGNYHQGLIGSLSAIYLFIDNGKEDDDNHKLIIHQLGMAKQDLQKINKILEK